MDPSSHARQPPLYQLRVQLRRISPPIWRRLVVPAESTIRTLHDTLLAAMGWEDCHCHAFTIRGQSDGVPRPGGIGFYSSANHVRLADFEFRSHERLPQRGQRAAAPGVEAERERPEHGHRIELAAATVVVFLSDTRYPITDARFRVDLPCAAFDGQSPRARRACARPRHV